jgi:DNA-binding transcriptional LysR family regulator
VVFSSNTYMVLQKAAIQGMGVALVPLRSIVNEVRSGKLQLVLSDWPAPDRPLYAVYAPGKHTVRKVRLFVDFIADWFREHPMLSSDPAEAHAIDRRITRAAAAAAPV